MLPEHDSLMFISKLNVLLIISTKTCYVISGTDGYQADYIKLYTDNGYYKCYYDDFLDDDASEQGHNCYAG